jgi:hypothetical protein
VHDRITVGTSPFIAYLPLKSGSVVIANEITDIIFILVGLQLSKAPLARRTRQSEADLKHSPALSETAHRSLGACPVALKAL